eukprot:CAMPEP_0113389186 /NCGR_PEP_ID=MMETSP0013_2-20120614/9489_1 /TAXON_ID=2843 ORGANISM="Skeletonema costatum, Strain 1716" /NCGR_SAMPLE_ID=MMETSP0013_2 /ASSEMBLY_ACC=CAM_ASM_000158 /LENGTH=581 /DNA_ID=CAMNT_0000272239 /DNA_START=95 /DNA_END=1840 /DNA_ORIENTATION=+ /assembly_acc=CAM_ASM_000158
MKAPMAAFLLSLALTLTLNNLSVLSSEITLDSGKPLSPPTTFIPPDEHTHHHIKSTRARRMAEQRDRVREKIASGEFKEKYHRITEEQLTTLVDKAYSEDPELEKKENQWVRRGNLKGALNDPKRRHLWGSSWGVSRDPYAVPTGKADTSADWEKWAQGYRHVGDFIDCSDMFYNGEGSHDDGDGDANCERWAAWCAYVDPYYAGGEYDEYFGDNAAGKLDCHKPDSDWLLLGCYAQEHYQWYEQISKHLWAIDDYEYVVALAGLAYMTDENCQGPYYDSSNYEVYFGPMPVEGGMIMMGAYSDGACIYPHEQTTSTYDDFYQGDGIDLGSKDEGQDDATNEQLSEWWYAAQEYTMELFNEVYSDYLYCTSCMDYPTYQDGYFIGDDGTDDDDLINQCWKFYSHDSFNLPVDGLAQAAMQGGLTSVTYGGASFGKTFDGQYSDGGSRQSSGSGAKAASYQEQRVERLKANLYLTVAGIVFVATFLAFAVARGSSKKKKSSSRSRSRRLLDADYGGSGSDRRRSSSRAKSSSGRSSRSASKARSSSGRSKSRSRKSEDGDYKAPSSDRARSKSRSRKSSSRK